MKTLLKIEEWAMLAVAVAGLYSMHVAWWWYVLLALGPDISMLGYLADTRTGAACYNLFHHKAVAIAVFLAGWWLNIPLLQVIGMVLFGHSSLDRALGYGLKFNEGFIFTHLGMIGKKKEEK